MSVTDVSDLIHYKKIVDNSDIVLSQVICCKLFIFYTDFSSSYPLFNSFSGGVLPQ